MTPEFRSPIEAWREDVDTESQFAAYYGGLALAYAVRGMADSACCAATRAGRHGLVALRYLEAGPAADGICE